MTTTQQPMEIDEDIECYINIAGGDEALTNFINSKRSKTSSVKPSSVFDPVKERLMADTWNKKQISSFKEKAKEANKYRKMEKDETFEDYVNRGGDPKILMLKPYFLSYNMKYTLHNELKSRIFDKVREPVKNKTLNELLGNIEEVDLVIEMENLDVKHKAHPDAVKGMKLRKLLEKKPDEEFLKVKVNSMPVIKGKVCKFQNISIYDNPECERYHHNTCWTDEFGKANKTIVYGECNIDTDDESDIVIKKTRPSCLYIEKTNREVWETQSQKVWLE